MKFSKFLTATVITMGLLTGTAHAGNWECTKINDNVKICHLVK